MMSLSCRTWFELTEVVCTVSSLPVGSGNSGSQLQLMDHKKTDSTVLQLVSSHIADRGVSVQSRFGKLWLTAISNRSSVRAVCGVCTSGSQPSPAGALSVQSAVFAPPAHSHLQPELCPCSLWCYLCYDWLMTGGPDDVTELPDLVRAHRGSLYSQ